MLKRTSQTSQTSLWYLTALIIFNACVILSSCGEDSGTGADEDVYPAYEAIQAITYYYYDRAVSPEYHRSYSITVTADTARVVVDCYGDTLAVGEYGSTIESFEGVIRSLRDNGIRKCSLDDADGCGGGTSEGVSCTDESNEIFYGEVYHCGGRNFGDLCGNTAAFADDVEGLIPDLDSLLQ